MGNLAGTLGIHENNLTMRCGEKYSNLLLKPVKRTAYAGSRALIEVWSTNGDYIKRCIDLRWRTKSCAVTSSPGDDEEEEEAEEEGGEEGGGGGEAAKKDEPPPELVAAQLEEARAEREREMPDLSSEPLTLMPFPLPTQLPKSILPDCVLFLQATDRFLLDRALRLPEEEVVGTHNNEEGFLRRLLLFRAHHAGSEVAAVLADEELKQTLSPIQMQRLIVASPSSGEVGNPVQQLVQLMAGSLDAGSVQAFFEDKKVALLTFDIMSETSKVSQLSSLQYLSAFPFKPRPPFPPPSRHQYKHRHYCFYNTDGQYKRTRESQTVIEKKTTRSLGQHFYSPVSVTAL
ncbi:unnamed protein product [Dibothriocephalus latus]|uniref:Uncharacterized protein n=1 Tax=Dibothriocephalus latus TaxID=60516 RepID=A0A3P7MRX6_DIBLA|nr:unnamed protein product [Dibothriocephalus latus]